MKPSPPLPPGPQRMATRPALRAMRAASSATAAPARSIRTMPGIPPAIVIRSASPISAGVSNSGQRAGSIIAPNVAPRGRVGKGPAEDRNRCFQSREFLLYRPLANRHDPR